MLYLSNNDWLGMPASIWVCLFAFAVAILVLGVTRPGRALYAIGGNVDAARAAGIRTDRVLWTTPIVASIWSIVARFDRPAGERPPEEFAC